MTSATCVLLYMPLFLVQFILLAETLRGGLKNQVVRRSAGLYLSLLGWLLCEIIFFSSYNTAVLNYVLGLSTGFRAFGATFMLLMVSGFYRIDRALSKVRTRLIFLPAVVAMVFAAVPGLQRYVIKSFTVQAFAPLVRYEMQATIYFYAQVLWNHLLVATMILMLILSFRKLPRGYRSGAQFLFIGFAVQVAGVALDIILYDAIPISMVLVGAALCGILFYFTTLVSGRHDFLHIERREVFHYLDEGIFILDENGVVLDANLTAQRLFHLSEIKYQRYVFDQLLADMVATGHVRRQPPEEDGDGEVLCFLDNKLPLFYHMQRQPVLSDSATGGKCVILTDRTKSQLLMERLRETAGVDSLTGLPNRYRYQELLRQLDEPGALPLSIIIGDVNGLKQINDTMGHYMGDTLLRNVADILKQCCPKEGYLARVGGDEFVLLLPRCPKIAAQAVMDEINRALAKYEGLPRPSIALGSATKTAMGQNINRMIDEADRKMYSDKKEVRK